MFEKKTDGTGTTVTKYYGALGRNVAKRVRAPGQPADAAVDYILADHLGSTVGLLDATGAPVAGTKTTYWPYGAVRTGGAAVGDKLYTGQQQQSDDGLALYDYGARFYSTTLGRFAAVDPIVGSARDPQSWNAYSYVRNNPLSYTDPTGRCVPGVSCPGDAERNQREHDDLVGALQYLAANHAAEQAWRDSNTISNGGSGDCDTACQWVAAARGFEEAALAQQRHEELVAALIYLSAMQSEFGSLVTADVGIQPAPYPLPLPPLPHRLTPEQVQTIEDAVSNVGGTFADAARWWHNLSKDSDGAQPPPETVAPVPAPTQGNPSEVGAVRAGSPGSWVSKERNAEQDIRKGDTWERAKSPHQGEEWDQYRPSTGEHRGVIIRDGRVIPKQEWQR